ncbi:MAG: D-alanyl-D-alanine dipeptidase [Saprospiraceae bacterium]
MRIPFLIFTVVVVTIMSWSCRKQVGAMPVPMVKEIAKADTLPAPPPRDTTPAAVYTPDYDTLQWTEVNRIAPNIRLDIRYATANNFTGQVLYACPRCFLRPEAAQAIAAAQRELETEGLGLKMFDCYRPRDVQWKLWEIFPQPGYVADPRTGSIHNRGGAVDLTIVDSQGHELDMGTEFDFFGPRANHTFTDLPPEVLENRQKLKALMLKHGFSSIRSEWWHYNFKAQEYPLADEEWNCPTGE